MPVMTRDEFQAFVDQYIKTNNRGYITAAIMRAVLDNLSDSSIFQITDKATSQQAIDGILDNLYLTPETGKDAIQANIKFNVSLTRSEIPNSFIFVDAITLTGELVQGDPGAGALYIRGTSGGLRAIQDISGQWWNLKVLDKANIGHFGAKIDGFTDDGPAVQAAIDYIASLTFGGCIYFPTGRCKIITPVNVPKPYGCTFFISGDGYGSVVLVGDVPGGAPAINIGNDGTASRSNYVITNIAFIGAGTVGKAINLSYANGARFDKVWFNFMRTAIIADNSYALRLSGVVMEFIEEYGFASSTDCHNLIVSNGCQFLNVSDRVKYPSSGVILIGNVSVNIVIRDNDFEGCGPPLLMSGDGHESTVFEGNYVEFCVGVIQSGKQYSLSVCSNQLNDNGTWAFPNCDGATISNNKINAMGITFSSESLNVDVGHNLLGSGGTIDNQIWSPVTLTNSWVNTSGSVPGFTRTADGICLLRGRLSGGTLGLTAFTLPVGYRPLADIYVTVSGASGFTAGQVLITSNGAVVPISAGDGVVYLDGLNFQIGG